MATLKCLACGHDNNVGDEWCSSCSSSLNLRLCSACEAINANDAERCHSCNAEFRIEPQVVTFEMYAPSGGGPAEAAAPVRALPAVWRLATEQARKRSSRPAALLALLPLLAAGAAYYFYAASPAAQAPQAAPTQVTPTVVAAPKLEPGPDPEAAPKEPVRPHTAEVRPAQAPAVSGKIAAPRMAAAPARSTPQSEPKRTAAAVTHTRATGAGASSRAAAADTPAKTAAADTPPNTATAETPAKAAVTTLPAASASAANAVILPVSERVTHTKADLTESAVTTAAPAAATQVRTVPAEVRNEEPAGCPPAVVALALCKSR
jgi:hypothetical protein